MIDRALPRQILDWVALLERLDDSDREDLRRHFLSLGDDDRRLRFGLPVTDAHIDRYVDGLDFGRDVIFGARSEPGFTTVRRAPSRASRSTAAPARARRRSV